LRQKKEKDSMGRAIAVRKELAGINFAVSPSEKGLGAAARKVWFRTAICLRKAKDKDKKGRSLKTAKKQSGKEVFLPKEKLSGDRREKAEIFLRSHHSAFP